MNAIGDNALRRASGLEGRAANHRRALWRLSGGDLSGAGCVAIYRDPQDLLDGFDRSLLATTEREGKSKGNLERRARPPRFSHALCCSAVTVHDAATQMRRMGLAR